MESMNIEDQICPRCVVGLEDAPCICKQEESPQIEKWKAQIRELTEELRVAGR